MLALYPKLFRRYVLFSILLAFGVVFVLLYSPGASPMIWIPVGILGLFALLVTMSQKAMQRHSQELRKLYAEMDAEGFVRDYSQHLSQKLWTGDTALMVRMHLSNAYMALGDFDAAERMLDLPEETFVKKGKPSPKKEEQALTNRYAAESNLCFCELQRGDAAAARARYDRLRAMQTRLEAMQETKPEAKRMLFSSELNALCLRLLEEGKTDVDALKEQVRGASQVLQKVTVSLWVAKALLAEDRRREGEELLQRVANLASAIYPGKEAVRILSGLPGEHA